MIKMICKRAIIPLFVITIIQFNVVSVGAGNATRNRQANLKGRSAVHVDTLKKNEQLTTKLANQGAMDESAIAELTEITNIILTEIIKNDDFLHYLNTMFEKLGKYAERQIATRSKKLKKVYKKWEKTHFPDPAMKKKVKNILVTEYKKNEKKKSRADRKKN